MKSNSERSGSGIENILLEQFILHEKLWLPDVYKLLYQAAMGCEHAISDKEFVLKKIEDELLNFNSINSGPFYEIISPDRELARVNLIPYSKGKGDLKILSNSFIRTAAEYKGSVNRLLSYWQDFRQKVKERVFYFSLPDVDDYFNEIRSAGFPAVHHSEEYRRTNEPHYRVVLWKFIADELEKLA